MKYILIIVFNFCIFAIKAQTITILPVQVDSIDVNNYSPYKMKPDAGTEDRVIQLPLDNMKCLVPGKSHIAPMPVDLPPADNSYIPNKK